MSNKVGCESTKSTENVSKYLKMFENTHSLLWAAMTGMATEADVVSLAMKLSNRNSQIEALQ